MKSRFLPAILQATDERNSISVERALNQIKALLLSMKPQTELEDVAIDASLEDLEMMLQAIRR